MTDRSRWSAVTGQAVERHDKGRGYEIGENEFLVIEDHELEAAREQGEGGRTTLPFWPDRRRKAETPVHETPPSPVGPAAAQKVVLFRDSDARQGRAEAPAPELVPAPRPRPEKRTIDIEMFVPRAQMDPRYFEKPYYIGASLPGSQRTLPAPRGRGAPLERSAARQ
jgi:DNA end-binding protein Ku